MAQLSPRQLPKTLLCHPTAKSSRMDLIARTCASQALPPHGSQCVLTPRVDTAVQNQITQTHTHTHTQRPQADAPRWLADAAAHATPQGGHSLLYAARRRRTAALCKRALATHAITCKIKRYPAPSRCIELRATALPSRDKNDMHEYQMHEAPLCRHCGSKRVRTSHKYVASAAVAKSGAS